VGIPDVEPGLHRFSLGICEDVSYHENKDFGEGEPQYSGHLIDNSMLEMQGPRSVETRRTVSSD
jgi:hypothetical protein